MNAESVFASFLDFVRVAVPLPRAAAREVEEAGRVFVAVLLTAG
jgi:hypothetical protein